VAWALVVAVIDGLTLVIALRGAEARRRRIAVVTAVVALVGCVVLIAAVVAANLGVMYLAALLLGVGGPVCLVLAGEQYIRFRRDPLL
jgi:hypothetical protein